MHPFLTLFSTDRQNADNSIIFLWWIWQKSWVSRIFLWGRLIGENWKTTNDHIINYTPETIICLMIYFMYMFACLFVRIWLILCLYFVFMIITFWYIADSVHCSLLIPHSCFIWHLSTNLLQILKVVETILLFTLQCIKIITWGFWEIDLWCEFLGNLENLRIDISIAADRFCFVDIKK